MSQTTRLSIPVACGMNENNENHCILRDRKWSDVKFLIYTTIYLNEFCNLPPSFSSALAWAVSKSLKAKHWYIPLSSRCTEGMCNTSLPDVMAVLLSSRGSPSFNQPIERRGWPDTVQLKAAGRPTSDTWRCGLM